MKKSTQKTPDGNIRALVLDTLREMDVTPSSRRILALFRLLHEVLSIVEQAGRKK